jgi:hypothetical protein
VISSSQRPLSDNTQHSQQTNFHAPGEIRTQDLSRQAALDRAATGTGILFIYAKELFVEILFFSTTAKMFEKKKLP